jgi:hypothetical protein
MEPASLPTVHHDTAAPPTEDALKDATRAERNSVVPPYWQRHERNGSRMSSYTSDGRPTPISLEDHTDETSDQCRVLWAKGVTIDDYVVVSGTAPGLGAYVVWNCTVETLHVSCPRAASEIQPQTDTAHFSYCRQSFPRSQWMARVLPLAAEGGRDEARRLQHAHLQIDGDLLTRCREVPS